MALTIWLVDNAFIHDVEFSGITVEYDECMQKLKIQTSDADAYSYSYDADHGGYLINFNISKHFEYSLIKTEEELGKIDGVKVNNLRLYSVQKPAFAFHGDNLNSPCKNVMLEKIFWNGEPLSKEIFYKHTEKNGFTDGIKYITEKEKKI